MLQLIRERAQGLIVWTILILIIITFALVGVNAYLGGGGDSFVATVNGEEVPLRSYQRAFQQEKAFRQQIFSNQPDSPLLDDELISRAALDRVINAEVATQEAQAAGFRTSNAELNQRIHAMQQFQKDGRFDGELYGRLLNNLGMSREEFEASMRRDMVTTQMIEAINETTFITDQELDRILRLRKQQRRFGYLIIKRDDFVDDVNVTEDEITAYYNDNQQRFSVPEQVRIDYLELQSSGLKKQGDIDEQVLRQMYEEQQSEFTVGEERRASHILIATESDDEKVVAQAQQKAEEIEARLEAGESFAELAKKYSDDPGSAAAGGDLDYFGRGTMVPSFEEAVFAMDVDEVSEPIRTPYGFHIIKLTDIRPGSTRPFDEVRGDLQRQLREQQAEEEFYDLADRLTNLTYEHPDTLNIAAAELGLKVHQSGYFTVNHGEGVAADPRIREAAFSGDVLEGGNNSDVIMLEENHLLVLRVNDRKPVTQRPLQEVRQQILRQVKNDKAESLAADQGQQLLTKGNKGEPWADLATEFHSQWQALGFVSRDEKDIPQEILTAAFSMPRPDAGQDTTKGFGLASGDYAIVALQAVRDGDSQAIPAKERDSVRDSLVKQHSQQLTASILASQKQRADIKEFPERLR